MIYLFETLGKGIRGKNRAAFDEWVIGEVGKIFASELDGITTNARRGPFREIAEHLCVSASDVTVGFVRGATLKSTKHDYTQTTKHLQNFLTDVVGKDDSEIADGSLQPEQIYSHSHYPVPLL